jgi:hypothetical protein
MTKEMKNLPISLCLVTAPRGNMSYLEEVLMSIEQDRSKDMQMQIIVLEVSLKERADIVAAQSAFPRVSFQRLINKTDELCPVPDPDAHLGRPGNVSCAVRQQAFDISAALIQCANSSQRKGWLVLIEDDTPLCRGALTEILFVLSYLNHLAAAPDNCEFRLADFSHTFSGTAVPAALAPALAARLADRAAHSPVDHAVWEPWARGAALQYGGNLLRHRGEVSAFAARNEPGYRREHDARRFAPAKLDCGFVPNPDFSAARACPGRRRPPPPPAAGRDRRRGKGKSRLGGGRALSK